MSQDAAAGTDAITYREAEEGDRAALVALGRASFDAAFGHLYSSDDLNSFLHSVHSPEAVAAQIADRDVAYRLAFKGEKLVGYCKLAANKGFGEAALINSQAKRPITLSQLYTDPAQTGRGIGAALMDWALAEAKSRRADAIQLSVWSENHDAQRFYARHGFTRIADIDFWVGKHRDDEFLYERML
ncbi:GNAT family N-acetyltransferase [Croceicoccus naphthovorans]|uniref:Acetyltransferase n=1 Tax=Croceicoccus naphthovorans TaxID=1348774 RepID=A0A0G3XMS6_9SPHN|nr:GNAT family N-acetyltransferase [Croceicoccus naphthovorans]AKM11946.1 acetyltransferase [Croceicoccus naphthovorans]MBB3989867.1 ribosomal protein S18 acetylase RimI-like enzyme [Croceicoccus naphthovorans]